MLLILALIAFLVLVGAIAKTVDLNRKREGEALRLQAVIADALLREAGLAGLAITPTAHTPLWRGSPVVITVSGVVPSAQHRETVVRVVNTETARIRSDFRVENLLVLAPIMPAAS